MQALTELPEQAIADFCAQNRLPPAFNNLAQEYYLPLAEKLPLLRSAKGLHKQPFLLGVSGAQGTGKSTLADFLELVCSSLFKWNVAVLSIDDFYLTSRERAVLADKIHPLLRTRGVPGTHDTGMLQTCLDQLRTLQSHQSIALPRFDKAMDDRADQSHWPHVTGPVDLVILEGWCVGAQSQDDLAMDKPVNELERIEDADAIWRQYANRRLSRYYQPVFNQLDYLVFLQAPSFDAILRWRLKQEQKLAARTVAGSAGLMSEVEISRFIQFYERLTRANLETLPDRADVVYRLGETHTIVDSNTNTLP